MTILDMLCKNDFLSGIDVCFAEFIAEISETRDTDVMLAAALASSAVGKKNVCVSLDSFAGKIFFEKTGKKIGTKETF